MSKIILSFFFIFIQMYVRRILIRMRYVVYDLCPDFPICGSAHWLPNHLGNKEDAKELNFFLIYFISFVILVILF